MESLEDSYATHVGLYVCVCGLEESVIEASC